MVLEQQWIAFVMQHATLEVCVCMCVCVCVCVPACLPACPSVRPSIHLSGCSYGFCSLFIILDYVMIPTPYYGGFDLDICRRARVKIYPVNCSSDNNYMPTIKLLEDTLTKAKSEVLT